mmetsp:Transcript_38311/g.86000  ORF Transcript_38311/g.86000 Transcript_38311/m.86000 type:complete len:174 (-) Transcript_38311:48-569(-)
MVWMSLLMISSLANAADREGEWSPALRCGVCRFIAENIGATVSKRVRAGLSHERKRARAQTCMESRKACSEIYIGPNLGLRKAGADAVEIVEDAVRFARGAGFGFRRPEELGEIARGTHSEIWVDHKLQRSMRAYCEMLHAKYELFLVKLIVQTVLVWSWKRGTGLPGKPGCR